MAVGQSEDDDYYRILGVAKDVSEEGLKRAYKRQALRWHPDKNQHRAAQAAERFKKVSEAYQVLSNKKSRGAYNRRRRTAQVTSKDEVLYSKTYGWSGVNISFYWTGPPPKPDQAAAGAGCPPQAADSEAGGKTRSEETAPTTSRSPLELFKDMFEMDSPLTAIDKQLDGLRRGSTGSLFESVFGSFKSFESEEEQPTADPSPKEGERRPDEKRSESEGGSTPPMSARQRSMAVIQEEYERGDLTEAEYKELLGILSPPTPL